ncbi:MAG TPA: YihY/virulence factor BrkB family protein [Xanthobacteraceae bacterium]|jgi:membrane protein
MRRACAIALDAFWQFLADDGWAIASHIALSVLMAMFPFFIVLTALAGFFGSGDLADQVTNLLLATWPEEVAVPLNLEIHSVLTTTHTGALTLGLVLAVYFSSNGVESLRIGLNRAYKMVESRNWILLRLESIGYVLLSALSLLVMGFLVVLGPLLFRTVLREAPWLAPLNENTFTFFRFFIASVVLIAALFVAHKWLPAGRRRIREITPGIIATLIMWLAAGAGFGRYLAEFSFTYVNMYAGLASAMIALVFLYWTASIFVYGGELNAARLRFDSQTREMEPGLRP